MAINATRMGAIVLIIFSVLGYLEIRDYPEEAAFLPRVLLILMFFLSVLLIFRSYKMAEYKAVLSLARKKQVFGFAAISLGYVILIHFAGYYITSALFISSIALFLRFQSKPVALALAVAFPAAIYFVFQVLLNIPVPSVGA